jgi:hypothetical protein
MGKITLGDPTAGFIRVTQFGPPIQSPPGEAVELPEGLATDHVAVIGRPPSKNRVERVDELSWSGAFGSFAEGSDLNLNSV